MPDRPKHWEVRGRTPEEDYAQGYTEGGVITKVGEPYELDGQTYWSVSYGDSWGCGVHKVEGKPEPKVGDHLVCFGRFGRPIHGQALNAEILWYETPEEQEAKFNEYLAKAEAKRLAEFEEKRPAMDEAFELLPPVFRDIIIKARLEQPDFRWAPMGEGYVVFYLSQAVLLAEWAMTDLWTETTMAEAACAKIDRWVAINGPDNDPPYDYQGQKDAAFGGFSDGHSGNTFDGMVYYAKRLVEGNV